MKILIISIGTKMPKWVETGTSEYIKRFKSMPDYSLEIKEITAQKRTKTTNIVKATAIESKALIDAVPKGYYSIALDVLGKSLSSQDLAEKIEMNHNQGINIAILIGGPEGFDSSVREFVNERWSLSKLTMPHPIVRIVLAETLYRSVSIIKNHPYHRAGEM